MKTKAQISFAVTTKLNSAFAEQRLCFRCTDSTARIVQSLYFLNPKFQASSHLLWLYSPVCVGPGRKPRRPVLIYFSRDIPVGKQNSPRCDAAFCIFKPGEDSVPYISYCALKHRLWVLVRKPQLGDSQVRKSAICCRVLQTATQLSWIRILWSLLPCKSIKMCCKHSIRRVPI